MREVAGSRCTNCGYYEDEDGAYGYCEGVGYGHGHNFIDVDADGMSFGPDAEPDPLVTVALWEPPTTFWERLRGVGGRS